MRVSKLLQEILNDPGAVFEFSADLPGGNVMHGTIGPVVNGRIASRIKFSQNPASEDDVSIARRTLDRIMGQDADVAHVSNTPAEHAESLDAMRKFFGGGMG